MATAGGYDKTSTLSLEWTLGELMVATARLPDHIYTQGFHQPALLVAEQVDLAHPLVTDSAFLIQVFPNPVEAILTVRIRKHESAQTGRSEEKLLLNLTDILGKTLQTKEVDLLSEPAQLNMGDLPAGVYLLHVQKSMGAPIKAYKVLKR